MTSLAPSSLIGSSSFLQVTRTAIKSQMGSKFYQIRLRTEELAAIESMEKKTLTYNVRNVSTTLVPSLLDGSLHSCS